MHLCGVIVYFVLISAPLASADKAPESLGASDGWKARLAEAQRVVAQRVVADVPERRDEAVGCAKSILDERVRLGRSSFERCAESCAVLDGMTAEFLAIPEIAERRRVIHELYFRGAFPRADGPKSLGALRDWCAKHERVKDLARVEEVLAKVRAPKFPSGKLKAIWRKRRSRRVKRERAYDAAREFRQSRSAHSASEVGYLVDWMREQRYAPATERAAIVRFCEKVFEDDAEVRGALLEKLAAVEHSEVGPGEKGLSKKELRQRRRRFDKVWSAVRRLLGDRVLRAAKKSLDVDEPGVAFDLFQYLLWVDPDNAKARESLGHSKVGRRWRTRYEKEFWDTQGFVWDETLGWIRPAERARYEAGEYFDVWTKQWSTIEKWNERHREPPNFARYSSEHFDLYSTADLRTSVEVLSRLERFFVQAFRQYDRFFTGYGATKRARLVFGIAKVKKRFKVYFYRNRDQFRAHAKPRHAWAGGFYTPKKAASFFYLLRDGTIPISTLQHEVTHQILGEFSRGFAHTWLVEGSAVFLESSYFRGDVLVLADVTRHRRVDAYRRNLLDGFPDHSLRETLAFETNEEWAKGDIQKNYRSAGALVFFLMSFDGGRYRGDLVDMLRDQYGGKFHSLEYYLGISHESLEFLMERFYRSVERASSAPGPLPVQSPSTESR